MHQTAPDPTELRELVESLTYKRGFTFTLHDDLDRGQGSQGMTLDITAVVDNSVADGKIGVHHYFIVPAASYNRASWARWLIDRIIDVETHEACEFYRLDGDRVFAPHHSEGEDPYTVWMVGDRETANKRSIDK